MSETPSKKTRCYRKPEHPFDAEAAQYRAYVGKLVKGYRQQATMPNGKRMTGAYLARKVGVTKGTISGFESGKGRWLRMPILLNIASVLKIPPSLLLPEVPPQLPRLGLLVAKLAQITDAQFLEGVEGMTDRWLAYASASKTDACGDGKECA